MALWLTFNLRDHLKEFDWKKIGSALTMGAAISAMHYTGMAAATFMPLSAVPDDVSHSVAIHSIGITGITVVTFVVLGTVLATSVLDRRLYAS